MRGYLGLGSNVGDRLANLRSARDALGRRGMTVTASSSVYETEPQGEILDQPDFLNACIAVETQLGPEELLDECKAVERELGRVPGGRRHAPRPIDVDLLLRDELSSSACRCRMPRSARGGSSSSRCSSWIRTSSCPMGQRSRDCSRGSSGQRVSPRTALISRPR